MIDLGSRKEVFFDDYLINTDEVHKEGAGVLNLGKRDIRYMESKDFVSWSEPERLSFGDSTNKRIGFDRSLQSFAGREVVMTVRMRDADLFSIRFSDE